MKGLDTSIIKETIIEILEKELTKVVKEHNDDYVQDAYSHAEAMAHDIMQAIFKS